MKLFIALFILLTQQVLADTVYKFELTPNDQIKESCDDIDGDITNSKISMVILNEGALYRLKLKAKLCTKKFGYRKVLGELLIPSIAMSRDYMLAINVGKQVLLNIDSTKKSKDSLTISRLADVGTLAVYKFKWQSSEGSKEGMESVQLYIEKNEEKFREFQEKFGKGLFFTKILYVHKQILIPAFILLGDMREASEESF